MASGQALTNMWQTDVPGPPVSNDIEALHRSTLLSTISLAAGFLLLRF